MSLSVVPQLETAAAGDGLEGRRGRVVTRRPGDRHEPIAITAQHLEALTELGRRENIPRSTLLALLVESSLAMAWADALGGVLPVDERKLDPVERSAAYARYLTWLTLERHRQTSSAEDGLITLPVRLVDRATRGVIDRALGQSPEQAIAFEVAAVRAGLTIGEWFARRMAEQALAGRQAL